MKGAVSEGGDCWHCPQGSPLLPTSTGSSISSSQPFPAARTPPPSPLQLCFPGLSAQGPLLSSYSWVKTEVQTGES